MPSALDVAQRLFICVCAFGSIGFFVWWIHGTYAQLAARTRLAEERRRAISSMLLQVLAPFGNAVGAWLGRRIDRQEAQAIAGGHTSMLVAVRRRADRMLTGAGHPHGLVPNEFLGLWFVSRLLGALLAAACHAMLSRYWSDIAAPKALLFCLVALLFYLVLALLPELLGLWIIPGIVALALAVLGYALLIPVQDWSGTRTAAMLPFVLVGAGLPWLWLRDCERTRKQAIRIALPYALDLLTLSVEAGLDFTAALARIVKRQPDTPLSQELAETLRQVQIGVPRAEALRDLHERIVMEEIFSVTSALIQADELGASLGPILRIQADQFRIRRAQAAEKQAMEAPVKLLFPLICFFFPATFIIIFGPIFLLFFGG